MQVSLSFDKDKVQPADQIILAVNAYSGSYVGLLAIDQSVLLLKGGNDVTQDMVGCKNRCRQSLEYNDSF